MPVKNTIVTEVIAPAACIKIFNNDTGMPLRVVEKMPDSIFVRTAGYDTMVYFAGEVPPIRLAPEIALGTPDGK